MKSFNQFLSESTLDSIEMIAQSEQSKKAVVASREADAKSDSPDAPYLHRTARNEHIKAEMEEGISPELADLHHQQAAKHDKIAKTLRTTTSIEDQVAANRKAKSAMRRGRKI